MAPSFKGGIDIRKPGANDVKPVLLLRRCRRGPFVDFFCVMLGEAPVLIVVLGFCFNRRSLHCATIEPSPVEMTILCGIKEERFAHPRDIPLIAGFTSMKPR